MLTFGRGRRRAGGGAVLVALLAAGCSAQAAPPGSGATVPTAPATTTTTSPADPYAVPAVITQPYVQRVLNALEKVEAQAADMIVANREITPTAAYDIRAVTTPAEFSREAYEWSLLIKNHLAGVQAHPGPVVDHVSRVISASSACIFTSVMRNFSAIATTPPAPLVTYFELKPSTTFNTVRYLNPTPWVINVVGYNSQDLVPADPCVSS